MKQMTLGDQQVQQAIAHFIEEARKSVETLRDDEKGGVLGFAAMSTILACVSAVGETVLCKKVRVGTAIKAFYDEMTDKKQWILSPKGTTHSNSKVCKLLVDIRDDLAQSIMLPIRVVLLPNRLADKPHETQNGEKHLSKWRLIVPEFIDAVEETIRKISQERPNLPWAPWKSWEKNGLVGTYPVAGSREGRIEIAWNTLGVPTSGSIAGSTASGTGDYPNLTIKSKNEAMSISLPTDAD